MMEYCRPTIVQGYVAMTAMKRRNIATVELRHASTNQASQRQELTCVVPPGVGRMADALVSILVVTYQ